MMLPSSLIVTNPSGARLKKFSDVSALAISLLKRRLTIEADSAKILMIIAAKPTVIAIS